MEIERETIGQAHDAIMRHLIELWKIEDEEEITTEDNERTIESPGMKVRVLCPWKDPKTSPALDLGPKALEVYVKELTGITPKTGTVKDFEYTYGNRLWDYPRKKGKSVAEILTGSGNRVQKFDLEWIGDGEHCDIRQGVNNGPMFIRGRGINQIVGSIVERLALNPTSRRAIAVTWVVEKDVESKEPPCLQFIQCLIRDHKLNLHAVFRSHDMAGGWGPNLFALEALQGEILGEINYSDPEDPWDLQQGYIETYSVSAHMYTSHHQVQKFREHLRI